MQGKVTLEDHFAIEATLGDSQPFGSHVWPELRHRLLDFQDQRLRLMDEAGVEIMIASLNAPAIQGIAESERAAELAREANDVLAGEVAKRPDRFVGVASFAAETSLHALRLIGSGLFDECPRLQIILGHLGEGLPYYLWRIDNRNNWMKAAHKYPARKRVADYFRSNFHITTSGHYSTPALVDAIAEIGADRVMFSVDYPFEDFSDAADWFDEAEIGEADRRKIGRTNAMRLFKLAGA